MGQRENTLTIKSVFQWLGKEGFIFYREKDRKNRGRDMR